MGRINGIAPDDSPACRQLEALCVATLGFMPNAADDARFERLRGQWRKEQVLEIVGAISPFGFLSRWNDTLAASLQAHPVAIAQKRLAPHGWTPGKHQNPPSRQERKP